MPMLGFDLLKKIIAVFALTGTMLAFQGCDNSNSPGKSQTSAGEQVDSSTEVEQQKFNLYVKAYNGLLDNTFGLVGSIRLYGEMKLDRAKSTDTLHAPKSSSYYTDAINALKQGRALSAPGSEAADLAADSLLKTLPVVIARIDEIEPYFNGGGYREDNLAKGKAQDPATQAAFQDAMDSLGQMDEALSAYQRRAQTAEAEAFRNEGNMPLYYTLSSLMLGTDMVNAMSQKDVSTADTIVPKLEASLEDLRKALVDVKDPVAKSSMDNVRSALTNAIGFMRQYKTLKQDSAINAMMSSYNAAVRAANNLH